jgi:hypothetical protein
MLEGSSNFTTGDHPFDSVSARCENSTWQQQTNSKDSLCRKSLGIPSILIERFVQNQSKSLHHKGTMSHHSASNGSDEAKINDVWMDTRKAQYSPKNINFDKNVNWAIESEISTIPTINNMYYQEVTVDDCDGDTGRYKSASRPIHRTQQEKDLLRQEEKIISAAEHEFDLATWRMYNRIMKHRQKRPLPDRYYDEVKKVATGPHDRLKKESNSDTIPSDSTATTTGTNSTSSSPSVCDSPKFTAIQHSKSRSRIPTCVKYSDFNTFLCGSELPQSVVSNAMSDVDYIVNDEEESDDEYADMMMFDLEL